MATKSAPDGVDRSCPTTTAAMNGSMPWPTTPRWPRWPPTTALRGVNQHFLNIAARITPLKVDTKMANTLLGPSPPRRFFSHLPPRPMATVGRLKTYPCTRVESNPGDCLMLVRRPTPLPSHHGAVTAARASELQAPRQTPAPSLRPAVGRGHFLEVD